MVPCEHIQLKLEEAVLITSIFSRITFTDYKLLSEWLDCYQYMYPGHRKLNNKLMLELLKMLTVQELVGHKGIYYRFWNYSTWIEHFTLEAQQRILEWILEKI